MVAPMKIKSRSSSEELRNYEITGEKKAKKASSLYRDSKKKLSFFYQPSDSDSTISFSISPNRRPLQYLFDIFKSNIMNQDYIISSTKTTIHSIPKKKKEKEKNPFSSLVELISYYTTLQRTIDLGTETTAIMKLLNNTQHHGSRRLSTITI